MAHNVTTNELAGGPVPAPTAERMSSVDSALDRLWHFLTSMKLALILMLVFAALCLVGTLVIQAPAEVAGDVAKWTIDLGGDAGKKTYEMSVDVKVQYIEKEGVKQAQGIRAAAGWRWPPGWDGNR